MHRFMEQYGVDPNEADDETLARSLGNPEVPVPDYPQLEPNSARQLERFPSLDQLGRMP
jgi:hypothetical protein